MTVRSGRSTCASRTAHTASNASANTGNASYRLTAHAQALRALAGEQERRQLGPAGAAGCSAATGSQPARAAPRGSSDEHRPMVQLVPARSPARTPTSTGSRSGRSVTSRRRPGQPSRVSASADACEPTPATAPPAGDRGLGAALGSGRLFQDDVGVGAADAERGDAGPARPVRVLGPRPCLGQQLDGARRPVHVRGGSSTCSVRGSTPCRIAMTILMIPATPAAACV